LLENALHHTGADAKFPADLEDADTAGLQFKNSRFHSWVNPTPAELRPIRPRPRQTGVDSLSDNPPLKLSKYTQHLKHRLAGSRRGIEPLLVKKQIDTFVPQFLEDAQQISKRSSKPVH
jgi:hypothetical protein